MRAAGWVFVACGGVAIGVAVAQPHVDAILLLVGCLIEACAVLILVPERSDGSVDELEQRRRASRPYDFERDG